MASEIDNTGSAAKVLGEFWFEVWLFFPFNFKRFIDSFVGDDILLS